MKNKTDLRALKASHRLEMVMIDTGEKFETGPKEWRSVTLSGLVVNLDRQTYRIERSGKPDEEGDVFTWLQMRYGWPFGLAVRYLVNRTPDAPRETGLQSEAKETVPVQKPIPTVADGKEPADHWQRKALMLAGDDIRHWFAAASSQIMDSMVVTPSRFLALVDAWVNGCEECGAEFDWSKPETICYLVQYADYGGMDMPDEERQVFFLDNQGLTGFVCNECKQEKVNYFLALKYCYRSAHIRERKEHEANKSKSDMAARRVEALAREAGKWFMNGGEDDYSYEVNRFISFHTLAVAAVSDEQIQRAFANRAMYAHLAHDRETPRSAEFWEQVILRFSS